MAGLHSLFFCDWVSFEHYNQLKVVVLKLIQLLFHGQLGRR
jgi:hypothetical protein